MKKYSLFIGLLYLAQGCRSSAPATKQMSAIEITSKKVAGTYKIDTVKIEEKRIPQTHATLTVGSINSSSEEAEFTVTYVSDNGETITNTVQAIVREPQAGLIFFFYPYVSDIYPYERGLYLFASGSNNEIIGGLPTRSGNRLVFFAKK